MEEEKPECAIKAVRLFFVITYYKLKFNIFQCKCTDDSETVVETNQKLRTAYRSNQNLCTLKSCSTGNLDEIVTDTIISVNKLKDEDFT